MGDKNSAEFFFILQNYKVIFNKSQVPSVRMAKDNALASLREEYLLTFGQDITIGQLKKKIQNMRNDVKKKMDLRITGKKAKNLKDWERGLLQLMEEETNPIHIKDCEKGLLELMEEESNPVFNRIPGVIDESFGVEPKKTPDCVDLESPKRNKRKVGDEMEDAENLNKKQKFDDETEETKNLSNQELKRLVLLRQLKLLNLDIREREERKKEKGKKEEERGKFDLVAFIRKCNPQTRFVDDL